MDNDFKLNLKMNINDIILLRVDYNDFTIRSTSSIFTDSITSGSEEKGMLFKINKERIV